MYCCVRLCNLIQNRKTTSFGLQEQSLLILLRTESCMIVSLPKDRFVAQRLLKVLNTSCASIYIYISQVLGNE